MEMWCNTSYAFKYGVLLVRIFLYLDWMQEATDQEKIRIWTLFTQCRILERFSSMLESNLFVAMFYQYVYIKFYVSFDQLQLRWTHGKF